VFVCLLQTKKILQLLRLRQINMGVFVRVSSGQNRQEQQQGGTAQQPQSMDTKW
jgi:hypothetical protein